LPKFPLVAIIDNDDSVGWAVARLVGSADRSVLVFPSAEEFIQSDQLPNTVCLVVDVQPPGMSGLQLQSHLVAAGRHIPTIFIIASADNGTRALARELGAINVLDPPGDQALLTLLKEIRLILSPRD